MKFRSKIILCFLFSILIPSILVTAVMYVGSMHIIDRKMDELTEKNTDSVRLLVQQRLAFIDELTTLISLNPLIQDVLNTGPSDNMDNTITQIIELDHAMDSYYISNYYASTSSPIVPVIYMIQRPDFQRYHISDRVRDISVLEHKSWYAEASQKNTAIIIDPDSDNVIITRKLYDLQNVSSQYSALLTVSLDQSFFRQLLNAYKSTPDSKMLLYDADENIISASEDLSEKELVFFKELLPELSSTPLHLKVDGIPAVISSESLQNADWTIVCMTVLDDINTSQQTLVRIGAVLLVICMALALFTALLLSRNLARPITAIVNSMRTVGDGNFSIDIPYHKNDEFQYLINQYNKMILRIRQLIDDLYISESNKQKAEIKSKEMQLKALQAQINPHFLYNTLDSINLYAIKYNVPQICDMITSLSDFFRYSLYAGDSIISLEEEIRHTRSYLELQTIRHGESLKYDFQIPGSLRRIRIVKLTLQPLVENAVLHGYSAQTGQLYISVKAVYEKDRIIISVSDNGAGCDVQKINDMLAAPEDLESESFAIRNVHERLQSAFGKDYGLHYKENLGNGITVKIFIPSGNKDFF